MVNTTDLAKVRATLWAAADELRANSKLTPVQYRDPVLGLVFLAYAENRFEAMRGDVSRQVQETADRANAAAIAIHALAMTERGAASLTSTVYLSGVVISPTAVNSAERGMLMPGGGLQMRSKVALTSAEVKSVPSWNTTPWRRWNV